ncbi:amidohydrolase family protein [Prolixibacteraceae bacterium]|nr:amidohydrolase family protein [Prolixibacteraceae bacterium]
MKIDAHQHFWNYEPQEYTWISEDLSDLQRDFLPSDLKPLLAANSYDGCIAVQALQTLSNTHWLLQLAAQENFIKGVVGWVDLRDPKIEEILEQLSIDNNLRGVRHVVQDEPDPEFMLQKNFIHGISHLDRFGLTYDILVFPHQLPAALELCRKFPQHSFVIDHIAKPNIKLGNNELWEKQIRQFKELKNVQCKVSGMVTEADWKHWCKNDFTPLLDVIVETFGTERIMYGSDWPVCLLAAEYAEVSNITKRYFSTFSQNEQDNIFGNNCERFYLNI